MVNSSLNSHPINERTAIVDGRRIVEKVEQVGDDDFLDHAAISSTSCRYNNQVHK
jgi:hypothetical protein